MLTVRSSSIQTASCDMTKEHVESSLVWLKPNPIGHIINVPRPDGIMYEELHYSGVIMSAMAPQIAASRWFAQPFVQAQIKENIKAPRHWHL